MVVGSTIEAIGVILLAVLPTFHWSPLLGAAGEVLHYPAMRALEMTHVHLSERQWLVAVVLLQLLFWMVVLGLTFWAADVCRARRERIAEPGVSPNGGAAKGPGNLGLAEGPPSVS